MSRPRLARKSATITKKATKTIAVRGIMVRAIAVRGIVAPAVAAHAMAAAHGIAAETAVDTNDSARTLKTGDHRAAAARASSRRFKRSFAAAMKFLCR